MIFLITKFQRSVSPTLQQKSIIEYFPLIGQPPKFDVCKKCDGLNEIVRELELDYIFGHADEDVYAKLVHIIWKHGDLYKTVITIKINAGPFRLGFITDLSITNKWVKNIDIHAKLRMAMRDKLNIKVSSTHKEVTDSGKKMHQKHIGALKKKVYDHQNDPFSTGPTKVLTSGAEIDEGIVKGLLIAPEIENDRYNDFMKLHLVEQSVSFIQPITRLNIDTK